MVRKRASSAHRRSLLHASQLMFFKHWVLLPVQGYIEMPKTAHPHEVLRIRKYTPSGDNPDIFFYKKEPPTDHITLDRMGELLVRKWLRSKKTPAESDKDDNFEKTFETFAAFHDGEISQNTFKARMKELGYEDEQIEYELDLGAD